MAKILFAVHCQLLTFTATVLLNSECRACVRWSTAKGGGWKTYRLERCGTYRVSPSLRRVDSVFPPCSLPPLPPPNYYPPERSGGSEGTNRVSAFRSQSLVMNLGHSTVTRSCCVSPWPGVRDKRRWVRWSYRSGFTMQRNRWDQDLFSVALDRSAAGGKQRS